MLIAFACVHAKSIQSCPTLCDPMDCSPPGSSVHGILQARVLEWLPCPPPVDLSDPGIRPAFPVAPALQAESLPLSHQGSPFYNCLCDLDRFVTTPRQKKWEV